LRHGGVPEIVRRAICESSVASLREVREAKMSCTREEKCKEAVRVLEALGDLEVLCVGSLAVEAVDPSMKWGTQHVDELDLLIHHKDLEKFMDAMDSGGYGLAEYDDGKWKNIGKGQVTSAVSKMPVSPEYNYAPKSCIGKPEEPHLWIACHTTTRHGRLMLVDLAEWFDGKKKYQGDFDLTVYRPPRWAVLLWQAAEVTCDASEQSIARHDIDRLRALAGAQGSKWADVLKKAKEYEAEYRERLSRSVVEKRFEAYQMRLKLDDKDMDIAERQYDARYELSHALKPVKDAVPPDVWAELEPITSCRPRKLWAYPGVKGNRPVFPPDLAEGRLGIAKHGFGIKEQLSNPDATFDELVNSGDIEELIPSERSGPKALAPGPWDKFTPDDMKSIGLP
jgi:hypothetical protein